MTPNNNKRGKVFSVRVFKTGKKKPKAHLNLNFWGFSLFSITHFWKVFLSVQELVLLYWITILIWEKDTYLENGFTSLLQ